MELHIDAHRSATENIVAPRGEIDMASAPLFRDVLNTFVRDGPAQTRVDLTGVSFMDSSGLGVLLEARTTVLGRGGSFTLVCPRGRVWRLLELAGVLSLFVIQETGQQTGTRVLATDPPTPLGGPPVAPT